MEQVHVARKAASEQPRDPVFLMAAARYGHLNKVRDLVEKQHMSIEVIGDEGFTLLHVAVANRRANVVEYLVKAGADVFAKNVAGETPYDLAKAQVKKDAESEVFKAIHGSALILGECKICFDSDLSLYTLPCGDQACVECIRNWFQSLLSENDPLKCPSAECQEMPQDEVEPPTHVDAWNLLSRQDFDRYDRQLLQRALVVTKDFQFCTECEYGGFIAHVCSEVICNKCEATWCKNCRLPFHRDISCEDFERIYAKDHEDNMKCMADSCKKCPACKAQIERDGGCSHMKCGQCKYEFCWWCLGKYQAGQYTFDEDGECPCDKLNRSGGFS